MFNVKASRSAVNQSVAEARERPLECIVVHNLGRFGRSALNLTTLVEELSALGIRFLATRQSARTDGIRRPVCCSTCWRPWPSSEGNLFGNE